MEQSLMDSFIMQLNERVGKKGKRNTYRFLGFLSKDLQKILKNVPIDARFSDDLAVVVSLWRSKEKIPIYW